MIFNIDIIIYQEILMILDSFFANFINRLF
jgi:hypothetical protein